MAEQFLRAYSINVDHLFDVVGSNNNAIIKAAKKKREQAEEVNDLIEECAKDTIDGQPFGLENALNDIINGYLDNERVYEYTRTLELLLVIQGKLLPGEVIFPGRGWQDIGGYISAIGLPTLQENWGKTNLTFPWKDGRPLAKIDWPISTLIKHNDVFKLRAELDNFDLSILKKHTLPERQAGLEDEMKYFIQTLKKWVKKCDKDIVFLLDGQQ